MVFNGAVIKEQGITFAVVQVKSSVMDNAKVREDTRAGFSGVFPRMPIVLMSNEGTRGLRYHGRTDISKFLSNINATRIPWKRYTLN